VLSIPASPAAPEPYLSVTAARKFFAALEGLRGVGALWILVFHSFYRWHGYLAVDLFVILSGFVVAQSALDVSQRPSGADFVRRRVARLWPLHVFALVAYAGAFRYHHGTFPDYPDGLAFSLLQHATLLHCVGFNGQGLTWNFPAWTVSVEFWLNVVAFYLVSARVRAGQLLIFAAICYVCLYNEFKGYGLNVSYPLAWGWLAGGMVRGLGGFALGWIAFRAYARLLPDLSSRSTWTAVEAAALAVLVAVSLRPEGHAAADYVAIPAMFALVTALARERGALAALLGSRPLRFLGRTSYGIFLLHIPLQEMLYAHDLNVATLGAARYLGLYGALVLLAATLAHYGIELPCRRRWAPGGTADASPGRRPSEERTRNGD
jgi:peptidoglycan/LPS O-acetylase OafA/YrhL